MLVLAPQAVEEGDATASALVRWQFQLPGEDLDQPVMVASGQARLALARDTQDWRLRQVERLVEGLKVGLGG